MRRWLVVTSLTALAGCSELSYIKNYHFNDVGGAHSKQFGRGAW